MPLKLKRENFESVKDPLSHASASLCVNGFVSHCRVTGSVLSNQCGRSLKVCSFCACAVGRKLLGALWLIRGSWTKVFLEEASAACDPKSESSALRQALDAVLCTVTTETDNLEEPTCSPLVVGTLSTAHAGVWQRTGFQRKIRRSQVLTLTDIEKGQQTLPLCMEYLGRLLYYGTAAPLLGFPWICGHELGWNHGPL